jgi:predicted dehydrogenase
MTGRGDEVIRAAVIGMGWMGGLHAGVYQRLAGVELVGVVEPDAAKRGLLAREYGVGVHEDVDSLLDAGSCDVVSVCAPDHLHAQAAIPMLAAGARVLVEKPLATTTEDARRILAARPDTDALTVGHILRFDPRVIRCREVVQSGELGEIWHVEVWRDTTRAVATAPSQRTSVAWFLGIHDADLVRFVTGLEVEQVSAAGRAVLSPHPDVVYANVRYAGGAVGTMENNWTLPDGRPNRALAGLRVTGSNGLIELDLGHVDLLRSDDTTSVRLDTRTWPSREWTGSSNIQAEVAAFVAAAAAGAPTPVSGEDGLAAVRVVELIHRSLDKDGAVVS